MRENVAVTPDGYFAFVSERGRGHFFLEVDRGTEGVSQDWQRKIMAYKEYYRSGMFAQRYGVGETGVGFRVLVMAPSAKRVASLKAAVEKYGPPEAASLFLLAPMDRIDQDMLTAPVWLRGGATGAQMLV